MGGSKDDYTVTPKPQVGRFVTAAVEAMLPVNPGSTSVLSFPTRFAPNFWPSHQQDRAERQILVIMRNFVNRDGRKFSEDVRQPNK